MGKKEGMLTIPNIVTLIRFLAGPICFYLIFIGELNWALFAFILAFFSDKLDSCQSMTLYLMSGKTNRMTGYGLSHVL